MLSRRARRSIHFVVPFLIFIGFWIFLMNQVQGGGSKVMSFGKSRAKLVSKETPTVTFQDVAGADEAYGSADKSVFVRSALMILPTLPRVIGPAYSDR